MESERERSKSAWGKNGEEKRPKLVQALRSKEAIKPDDEGRCRYFKILALFDPFFLEFFLGIFR